MDIIFLYQPTNNRLLKALPVSKPILDGIISLIVVLTDISL